MVKKTTVFLVLVLFINIYSAFAYDYPNSFWNTNSCYEQALNTNNYSDIITYGNQIINLMGGAADGAEKRNIMVTRYNQIGLAYAALGDYNNSAYTFNLLYDYASKYGDEFYDYLKAAKARSLQYTPQITLYTDGGISPYYGAINEKKNGVLFGTCANGETRSKIPNESMLLTYQELGQNLLAYNTGVVRNASSAGIAVEFALNCPNEGTDIRNIKNKVSYLKEISDMFKKYSDVPIYLRFAAEFDIWENLAYAEEFKTAFRYVSDYFKNRNTNVAVVWSPNQVSNWNINIDDYYPGDEYVDWVGVSSYAQRYFLGDKTQKEENEIVFKTGFNSNPVLAVSDIVKKYGNRKPIMISEMGCGHKLVNSGENTTDFALNRLKEYYSYLPMVYPQIKLIAYFDWFVNSEKNDFRLSSNSSLQSEYINRTKGSRFIQDSFDNNTDFCYRQIVNGTKVNDVFTVSCYAHKYRNDVKSVSYFIDDNYVGMSNEIPFTTYIDATSYSGNHRLKAIASFTDGQTLSSESDINIYNTNSDITVEISGDRVYFDQEPVIYNNRTMVPMSKIFEELGANVSWDNDTQTATGKKGDRMVKVTVDNKTMYVNKKQIMLDTVPFVMSDRTLVPVRAVAEGLGCDVDWDDYSQTVLIEPKVFKWSNWVENLPDNVDEDLFYIEEKTEYRYREKTYFEGNSWNTNAGNFVREDMSYGDWSNWQDGYISSSNECEVETRTQSSPKKYHYAHWCTGNLSDESKRYKTSSGKFCDECSYHDLGWFDYELTPADDGVGYINYIDGKKQRCSNTCYRWYSVETSGGTYTQYRSRQVYHKYIYWQYTDWSEWSENDVNWNPNIDIDERTMYRYKEK